MHRGINMNCNLKTNVTLSLKQLFIADHGIRERLKRQEVSEREIEEENEALDAINAGIHQILRVGIGCDR